MCQLQLHKILTFKEGTGPRGNYVEGMHNNHYLFTLLEAEDSPFRTFLDRISPDVKLSLMIELVVIENNQ